jgi:predicted lactoylglutathione lyase
MSVENTVPILFCKDINKTKSFYLDELGFTIDWQDRDLLSLSINGHSIMISETSKAFTRGWVWLGLSNESMIDFIIDNKDKFNILQSPTNQEWAYEMKITDLDDNVLWFGAEPRSK